MYAVGFFVGLMIMTLAENAYFDRVVKTGVRVRASLVPCIYKHAMKMTNDSRQERSTGAIVNHMASDTERLQTYCHAINNLWSAPFRLTLGVVLLISSLGVAGIFGVLAVCMVIPVQTFVIKKGALMFKEVMKKSDTRIKILNEVLSGMRVIKFYAWEVPFEKRVEGLRADELSSLKSAQNYRALQSFFMNFSPVALSIGTFVAFAALKGNISPAQAFQALALFQQMVWPLMLLPQAFAQLTEALVAAGRIESYLLTATCDDSKLLEDVSLDAHGFPEGMDRGHCRISNGPPEISIRSGYFSWGENSAAQLIDINLEVRPGELLAIVGPTGSGKSSLVNAMLGEMNVLNGQAKLCGSAAYAPQQAWIFNATVRENIVFGNDFDEQLYNTAIDVSCLRKDIEEQFDAHDQTEIGEKGINMSGGQRQRLNIARSVYSQADIFVFDDPLSALDAHVTADVFRLCLKEHLREKTRVLVTNQLHLMPQMDRIVVMDHGKIHQIGTFEELFADEEGEFFRLYSENINSEEEEDHQEPKAQVAKLAEVAVEVKIEEGLRKRAPTVIETKALIPLEAAKDAKHEDKKDVGKLIQKEHHASGTIKWAVYAGYLLSLGLLPCACTLLMNMASVGLSLASSIWLGIWAGQQEDPDHGVVYYISIYVLLSLLTVITLLVANLVGYAGSVSASRLLHANLISSLLRAPISFFDSTPLGRITNRMSKDINMVDNSTMMILQMVMKVALGLVGTLIIIGINTTYVLVPFVPIITIFIGVQNYFRATSVQLKRLDAVSRSPLYAHFTESLNGLSTIRAYLAQGRMSFENTHKLDENQRIFILAMTSNRWLSIRLEFLGGLLIMTTAINCVLLRNSMSAAAAGIAMAYSLQITSQLNIMVRMTTELENAFNSVERIQEYTNLESEAALKGPGYPPKDWPHEGRVEMKDLVVSYRPGLPPVIKGVSLVIEPTMKVGVCGRTGAGKSTLFQALFRMMEASSGTLTFDGVDVSGLGLEDVRNAISIIPQEPVLFSGSLRSNLDPFGKSSGGKEREGGGSVFCELVNVPFFVYMPMCVSCLIMSPLTFCHVSCVMYAYMYACM
jgi:ATP-binding cassette, subfamily C (CFTR/MRP), member 1